MEHKIRLQDISVGFADVYRGDTHLGWVERRKGTEWLGRNDAGGHDSRNYTFWQAHLILYNEYGYSGGPMLLPGDMGTRREAVNLLARFARPPFNSL